MADRQGQGEGTWSPSWHSTTAEDIPCRTGPGRAAAEVPQADGRATSPAAPIVLEESLRRLAERHSGCSRRVSLPSGAAAAGRGRGRSARGPDSTNSAQNHHLLRRREVRDSCTAATIVCTVCS